MTKADFTQIKHNLRKFGLSKNQVEMAMGAVVTAMERQRIVLSVALGAAGLGLPFNSLTKAAKRARIASSIVSQILQRHLKAEFADWCWRCERAAERKSAKLKGRGSK
jgi:lantibiotic modifying enzyme